jgi:hypothetical protein
MIVNAFMLSSLMHHVIRVHASEIFNVADSSDDQIDDDVQHPSNKITK